MIFFLEDIKKKICAGLEYIILVMGEDLNHKYIVFLFFLSESHSVLIHTGEASS